MFRKIVLSAFCVFAAVAVIAAPKVKVDQSTKAGTAETFIRAIAYDDADALWRVLDPTLRQYIVAIIGSEADARKQLDTVLGTGLLDTQKDQFKQNINDPESKKASVQNLINQNPKWFVKKNGKWYINMLNR